MAHRVRLFTQRRGAEGSDRAGMWWRVGAQAFNLAVIAAILSSVYLFYGLLSQHYSRFPMDMEGQRKFTAPEQAQLLGNFGIGLTVLAWSCWIAFLLAIGMFWEGEVATAIVGGTGVVFYVGLPLVVNAVLGHQGLPANRITEQMVAGLQSIGKVGLVLAMLRFVAHTLYVLSTRPAKTETQVPKAEVTEGVPAKPTKAKERRHLLRRCWEVAYCSERLRYNCPSYLTGASCWRRHTGCRCDPFFATRVLEPMSRAASQRMSDAERASLEAAVQHLQSQDAWQSKHHAERETCGRCPIYMEHQQYKYRAVFWLAYPLAGVAMYIGWPFIHGAYQWTEKALTAIARGMKVLPDTRPELAPFVNTVLTVDVEYIVVAAIALVIVASLLRAFEWAIFEAKV